MFTDIFGFSKRMAHDEAATIPLVKRDLNTLEDICTHYGGRVVKSTGDGLLMLFCSPEGSLRTSLDFQKFLQSQIGIIPDKDILAHRIGMHAGEYVTDRSDIMGEAVNLAQRVMSLSPPDTICMSRSTFDMLKDSHPGIKHRNIGPQKLKGYSSPVEIIQIDPDFVVPGFETGQYVKPFDPLIAGKEPRPLSPLDADTNPIEITSKDISRVNNIRNKMMREAPPLPPHHKGYRP